MGALQHVVVLGDFAIERGDGRLAMVVAAKSYRYTGEAPPSIIGEEPVPAAAAALAFGYDAAARRSPFAPLAEPSRAVSRPAVRPAHPAARHALAQLRMVGTLAGRGAFHALVRDPSGHVHRVAVGDVLGVEAARVSALDAAEIRLDAVDAEGQARQATLVMGQAEPATEAAPEEEQQ
jgi:Tfp pilus assembly protein PilP